MNCEKMGLNKSKRFATALALFLIFAELPGCCRQHNHATLWGWRFGYYLELSQVVDDWGFDFHNLCFSRYLAVHRLDLPGRPPEVTVFDASQLKLTAMSADGRTVSTALISGKVWIDVPSKRAVIDLTTSSGPFSGNGVYPLSTIEF